MAFLAPLVAEREHYAGLAAGFGQGPGVGDGVGNRFVEEDVLAGLRRGARRLEVHVVRRGVNDRSDAAII
ncbi:hypothetical protein D3C83_48500 [compost metagenome]